jgi:LacI family transcriptional regulator
MIDVARAAGVSRTTASFVLNGRDASIPPETQERVRHAAERLGYRPHDGARSLATGRTNRIGILLNQPESFSTDDPYFTNLMRGITGGALRNNYNLLLYSARYPDHNAICDGILNGTTDGMLLASRYTGDGLVLTLLDADMPCVCVSFCVDHPKCHAVDCDNEQGSRLAVEHLIQLGHRHIVFFHPEDISWGRERVRGALQAMATAGLPPENLHCYGWTETCAPSSIWVAGARQYLHTMHPVAQAAVCCDEWRAQQICETLPEIGLRVPEDVALISFNSTAASARAHPPMTSVAQPLAEIGAAAVDMLVEIIAGRSVAQPIRRFPMHLDIRESCGVRQAAISNGSTPPTRRL